MNDFEIIGLGALGGLALSYSAGFLEAWGRIKLHQLRARRTNREIESLATEIHKKVPMRASRDVRLHAREMVRVATEMGKLDLLRAMVERELEKEKRHPLALQVRKLLAGESGSGGAN